MNHHLVIIEVVLNEDHELNVSAGEDLLLYMRENNLTIAMF
jgi:hypothetical protein